METNWKLHQGGNLASRVLENGCSESKLISALSAEELAAALPADPLPVETIIADFTAAIQKHLDDFAKTRGYDGILSACTYATSLVPKFKAEGQCCVEARDATWSTAYAMMAEVTSGAIPMPTRPEVISAMPVLSWPV